MSSCTKDKRVDKIEIIGVEKFKQVEFALRDGLELYSYRLADGADYRWTYDPETQAFDFASDPDNTEATAELGDLNEYGTTLRENVRSLEVVGIQQSPWNGNLLRFWISNKEFICYVDPNFNFDEGENVLDIDAKRRWRAELENGRKIDGNWYHVVIDR